MDFAEPLLQAEIMTRSSMTASLILTGQYGREVGHMHGGILWAAALDNEDILVAH